MRIEAPALYDLRHTQSCKQLLPQEIQLSQQATMTGIYLQQQQLYLLATASTVPACHSYNYSPANCSIPPAQIFTRGI